ncbi:MAG: patatin family protein [Lachnospiraceae bacterium]|nr:patatin family protein [Candidatus Merdinaster equi]
MKSSFVLEGGAMKGLFTCGVLDVFMDQGIKVDGVVGVSAGACFGCNYISKQPGRALRYNLEYANDSRYCSVSNLIKCGDIYEPEFCYHTIPDELDPFDTDEVEKSDIAFYTVSTDVETGKAHYHRFKHGDRKDLEWMRASASMPLAANMVEIDGRRFLDGGVADSVPLRFMQHKGYDKNIVILTKPRDYIKGKNNLLPLIQIKYRKYPNLVKAIATRHIVYNRNSEYIKEQEKLGNCFVIAPDKDLPVGHISHDRDVLLDVYDIGYEKALQVVDDVKKYLAQ